MVGLEFAYLARLGLRDANDSRMRDTLTVVKALIEVETPAGPGFYRYNHDGYGEHEDGPPYDGTGVGRLWPLLTGERGHLALLQGEDPTPYLNAMMKMTGACGLLPEQVWDRDPLPDRGLFPGRPTGSAMPLVWAHAEFLKLLLARGRGRPIELLDVVRERYHAAPPKAATWFWRAEVPIAILPPDRSVVIEDTEPFVLHFGRDGWGSSEDRSARPTGLGLFGVRLDHADLRGAREVRFTRFYPAADRWEGQDHLIALAAESLPAKPRRRSRGNR